METERCPCCGGPKVPGLFDYSPEIPLPAVVDQIRAAHPDLVLLSDGGVLSVVGRHFIRCEMGLPLRADSPLRMRLWLEIREGDLAGIAAVEAGQRRSISGIGTMACEITGFPGTLGMNCRYRLRAGAETAEVTACSDLRIERLPAEPTHDEYVDLYRSIWGNKMPVDPANVPARRAVSKDWQALVGRRAFAQIVEPPPQLAGVVPAEILSVPPLDTGDNALLATVGCCDVPGADEELFELMTTVRNPSEDFIACFGEFAYITRMNGPLIEAGAIIPERKTVPGSDGQMVAWLLCDPWWEGAAPDTKLEDGRRIHYLAAVPILSAELAFAAIHGAELLATVFAEREVDITSLTRSSIVEEAPE